MQQILHTSLSEIYFDKKKSLIKIIRTVPVDCDIETYKKETLVWAKVYSELKPKLQLVDMTYNYFIPDVDLQKWINDNLLNEAMKNGLLNVAMVVSNNFFVQLSHEVIMELSNGSNFTTRYFNNKTMAREWLINSIKS